MEESSLMSAWVWCPFEIDTSSPVLMQAPAIASIVTRDVPN